MNFDISIIVVTYNSDETIEECIASVQAHCPKRYNWNIVVVDNKSTDRSVAIVRQQFPGVTLIENQSNLGFGVANNIGMSASPSRYYYLHNSDAFLAEDELDTALDYLDAAADVGIAGFPLVYPDRSAQTSAYSFASPAKWAMQEIGVGKLVAGIAANPRFAWFSRLLAHTPMGATFVDTHSGAAAARTEAKNVDWVCGAALILRDEVLQETGGFDPGIFLYGEDQDLCLQAHRKGWKVQQLALPPVIHVFGWGKRKKASSNVTMLRVNSLKYYIDKNFSKGSVSWMAMRVLLQIKKFSWSRG